MNFSIDCLEIIQDEDRCVELYKNLSSKRYFFNDLVRHSEDGDVVYDVENSLMYQSLDFYKNSKINIQAVVGMNGSGKSTLMDLMYMTMNNFAYMFLRKENQLYNDNVLFINGLYAHLFFTINEQHYRLGCLGKRVFLEEYPSGDSICYYDYDAPLLEEFKSNDVAKSVFYTISSNYSLLSFIPNNNVRTCLVHNSSQNEAWVNRLFHKNDGYRTPVVLNPCRKDGKIDLNEEMRLSEERLFDFLVYAQLMNYEFDGKYQLKNVQLTFNTNFFLKKVGYKSLHEFEHSFDGHLGNKQSIVNTILKKYCAENKQSDWTRKTPLLKKVALAYIIYKIRKIRKINAHKSIFDNRDAPEFNNAFFSLMNDLSHVTKKIKRCFQIMALPDDSEIFKQSIDEPYSFEVYNTALIKVQQKLSGVESADVIKKYITIDRVKDNIPPSFFDCKITLHNIKENKDADYKELSSGELQLMQLFATHLYHISNIQSIYKDSNRLQYDKINLVFDEVELSLHPEFQRQFVFRLVNLIHNFKLDDFSTFNIFVLTHSPFILSDIPSNRILYVKEGSCKDFSDKNTFGANLNDLVKDSFFLDNGFSGEYATQVINSLADFLTDTENDFGYLWNRGKASFFIENIVGESILKKCLMRMFERKYSEG